MVDVDGGERILRRQHETDAVTGCRRCCYGDLVRAPAAGIRGAGELIRVIAEKGGLGPMVHAPNQPPDHPLQPCAQGHQRRRWVCKVASQYGRFGRVFAVLVHRRTQNSGWEQPSCATALPIAQYGITSSSSGSASGSGDAVGAGFVTASGLAVSCAGGAAKLLSASTTEDFACFGGGMRTLSAPTRRPRKSAWVGNSTMSLPVQPATSSP